MRHIRKHLSRYRRIYPHFFARVNVSVEEEKGLFRGRTCEKRNPILIGIAYMRYDKESRVCWKKRNMVVSLAIGAFVLQYICAFTYAIEIGWDSPSRDVLDTVATKLKYFQKEPELFCEHKSSCGHHADSGPTHSPQDPKAPGDGKECYCYGLNPVNGQRERLCYIGRCDYGKKKSEMRDKRVEDIVSDFTMSRIPKNTHTI